MNAQGATGRGPGFTGALEILGAAAVVGQLVALIPPGPSDWAEYGLSWGLLGAIALFMTRYGRRTAWWAGAVVPLGYLAAATALLQSESTARTGLNLLLLLPVLWSSLHLRAWKSAVTVAAAVGLEIHFALAANNSSSVVARSLVLWTLVGSFIAVSTHTLRRRLERANAASLESARMSDALRVAAESLIGMRSVEEVQTVATDIAAALASPPGVARRAAFYRIDGSTAACVAERDDTEQQLTMTWPICDNPLVEMALRQGRAVTVPLAGLAFSPDLRAVVDANGITHGAAIPVMIDRLPFGVLTIASRGAAIPPELLDVLTTLGHLFELAMANAITSELADTLATTDSMTGLLNRRGLEQAVIHGRSRRPFTLVAFDLDGLKQVNDRHGHPAGDELIRTFAAIVRSRLRASDALARLGGDEFLAVIFDSARLDVEALAEEILDAVSQISVAGLPIRSSIGIAHGDPADHFDEVAARADAALYAAKQSGGAQYLVSAGP